MTQDEEIRAGLSADRLMGDPLMVNAFETVERGIIDALKLSKLVDKEQDRELVLQLKALALVKGHLTTVIQTGKLASLAKEESLARRALRRVVG